MPKLLAHRFDAILGALADAVDIRGIDFSRNADVWIEAESFDVARGVDFSAISDQLTGSFAGRNLSDAVFNGMSLRQVNFERATIRGGAFVDTKVSRSNLSSIYAPYGDFRNCDLQDRNILQGGNYLLGDLSGANFTGADLTGCTFTGARIHKANFSRANLRGVSFVGADLRDSVFDDVVCENTMFCFATNISGNWFPVMRYFEDEKTRGTTSFSGARLSTGELLPSQYQRVTPPIRARFDYFWMRVLRQLTCLGLIQPVTSGVLG